MKKTISIVLVLAFIIGLIPGVARAKLVACVGDSNTYGALLSNRVQDCYPAKLERILQRFDPSWETRNFGVNSATVLKQGALPYTNLSAYNQALASEPDVVILCFGANASRPQSREYIEGAYFSDYISIIDAFAELYSKPKVWICYPLKAFSGSYGISDTIIKEQIIPLITQIASERNLPIIDFYTAFEDSPHLFHWDGIHPNSSGTALMAEIVATFITGRGDVPDFNGDGIVDSADMCIMVNHWHKDDSLCDIAPLPSGDGIVDIQDLVMLAEYLFEPVIDITLVTHWALDEVEGDIASDSANDNDGTVYGDPAWQPEGGMVDGALQLDGIDDYVEAPFVLNPTEGPFSVFIWIKGGAPGQVVISQPSGLDWLAVDAEGKLMTELSGLGQSLVPIFSEATVTDGQWHRIGFVWDGANRTLYVDGVAVAEDTQDSHLSISRNGLYIGAGKAMQAESLWSGLIDDVRIYKRLVRP